MTKVKKLLIDGPSTRIALAVIIAVWVLVQIVFYFLYGGIHPANDTERYMGAAMDILAGQPVEGKVANYPGYNTFIALTMFFGGGSTSIVLFQMFVSLVAAVTVWKIGALIFGNAPGFIAALAFAAYPTLQQWNFYILTESLFISLLIISIYVSITARTWPHFIVATCIVLFTVTIRPNGFIVLIAVLAYMAHVLWIRDKKVYLVILIIFSAAIAIFAFNTIDDMASQETILTFYEEGVVIYDYQSTKENIAFHATTCRAVDSTVGQIFCFFKIHPLTTVNLIISRFGSFILHVRPYWSDFHNIFSLVTLIPIYLLAITSFFGAKSQNPEAWLLVTVFFLQATIVSFTIADWDGRFLDVVLTPIIILASGGLFSIVRKIMRQLTRSKENI
jgi:hypothetical protein